LLALVSVFLTLDDAAQFHHSPTKNTRRELW